MIYSCFHCDRMDRCSAEGWEILASFSCSKGQRLNANILNMRFPGEFPLSAGRAEGGEVSSALETAAQTAGESAFWSCMRSCWCLLAIVMSSNPRGMPRRSDLVAKNMQWRQNTSLATSKLPDLPACQDSSIIQSFSQDTTVATPISMCFASTFLRESPGHVSFERLPSSQKPVVQLAHLIRQWLLAPVSAGSQRYLGSTLWPPERVEFWQTVCNDGRILRAPMNTKTTLRLASELTLQEAFDTSG